MRNVVAYYENRILRKQIAIEEILHNQQCRELEESKNLQICKGRPTHETSVFTILSEATAEMNGSVFQWQDLRQRAVAKYPDHAKKIVRNLHPTGHRMLQKGILIRVPGGLTKPL